MPAKKNMLRRGLVKLLGDYAVAEGTDMHGALRDALTDLRHIADDECLDFDFALNGSDEVYNEEKELQNER